jgi:hypothetical protein
MTDTIVCPVTSTRCLPLHRQLLRHTPSKDMRRAACALRIHNPAGCTLGLVKAMAVAMEAARENYALREKG